ncbi:MAG: sulfide/dihydroorotate dehydrogenase-like FAD/NAD-binding protein [Anaerolineales bacterium]|nr:sulfide/dihydroorotate dehydrogenase-like FAD/NAD-binding protein [Anaerolineales bacterium]
MYKILKKQVLSDLVTLMEVSAPQVTRKAQAGQFVIVRAREESERIPLTIADFDRAAQSVTLVIQQVGKSTMQMCQMNAGDEFATVAGPLGHATEIEKFGAVICIGGGVGIAPVYPIARALKEAGNHVISIIGARNQSLLFWEEKMRAVSDELIVTTDDGSYGRKALVTEPLKEILTARQDIKKVWAIGPAIMMKFVAATTKTFNVPTIVSLNTIMIDGTGMCGGCRVLTTDGAQFVCVDGPEFDAHKVDWDVMMQRMQFYREEEKLAVEQWKHQCKLASAA